MGRPKELTLIAQTWIFFGIAAIGVGVIFGLPIPGRDEAVRENSLSRLVEVPRCVETAEGFLIRHMDAVAVGELLLGILMLVSGIQFLKLRSWARTSLEVMSWVGSSWSVGVAVFWVCAWIAAARAGPRVDERLAILAANGILIHVGIAYVLVRMIQSLRSEAIRDAVA